jgi:hypothetical protein
MLTDYTRRRGARGKGDCGDCGPQRHESEVKQSRALRSTFPRILHVSLTADGSGKRRVTATRAHETNPAFSPDGTRMAFIGDRDNRRLSKQRRGRGFERYTMALDGSDIVRVSGAWSAPPGQTTVLCRDQRTQTWSSRTPSSGWCW